MIQSDAAENQVCLNNSQIEKSPDGSVTYIISEKDPEVANWLDTVGINSGVGVMRWQKVPADMTGDGLIRDYRVVKIRSRRQASKSTSDHAGAAQGRHDEA